MMPFSRGTGRSNLRHLPRCYNNAPVPRAVLEESLSSQLQCALFHQEHSGRCKQRSCVRACEPHCVNFVRGCRQCTTDVSLAARDVEGIGRVLILTTWTRLGGVYEGQHCAWDGLTSNAPLPNESPYAAATSTGHLLYAAYENIRPKKRDRRLGCSYVPQVSDWVTELLTVEPNVLDEEGWDRHIPEWDCSNIWSRLDCRAGQYRA